MPFERKDDSATREAATARVIERQFTNPADTSVFRVVSDEFRVDERALRSWVVDATPAPAARPATKRRPRFSPVVVTKIAAQDEPAPVSEPGPDPVAKQAPVSAEASVSAEAPLSATPPSPPSPSPAPTPASGDTNDRIAELQAEVARLRHGNDSLKAAIRVVLDD